MSDQQLVTGLAILISGYSELRCGLSFYHWQIITTLTWYSSITHIATLMFLRQYLRRNKYIWYVRALLMVGLAVMLAIGLLPTGSSSVSNFSPSGIMLTAGDKKVMATPAICFFNLGDFHLSVEGLGFYVIFSEILLVGGLLLRLIQFSTASRRLAFTILRTVPGNLWRKTLVWTSGKLQGSPKSAQMLFLPAVSLSLVIFVALQSVLDYLGSDICGVGGQSFSFFPSLSCML